MIKTLSITDAEKLNNDAIKNILILEADNPRAQEFTERMYDHTHLVAEAARQIAAQTKHLNPQKAYIYGLLHDYGRFFGDVEGKKSFHGWVGYEKLMEKGCFDVAKINLTHTFLKKEFNIVEYHTYNQADLLKTKHALEGLEYDDYDRLIQLSDLVPKMFGGYNTIESRFERIQRVYKLSPEVTRARISEALEIKEYFDKKCNCDVYQLLEIRDDK